MARKFVQISAIQASTTDNNPYAPMVFGLADDGTVWYSTMNPTSEKFEKWEVMPNAEFPAGRTQVQAGTQG
jgi:hypothetical protein